jgi:hypothetical protein
VYTIIRGLDGKIRCEGRLQDSTERWTSLDVESAIKSMKDFAKHGNGMKIKRKDISFLQEDVTLVTQLAKWSGK